MSRGLLLVGTLAALWAGGVAAAGGFDARLAGIPVRSHNPLPAAVVAALCFAGAFARGFGPVRDALAWWWTTIERRAAVLAAFVSALGLAIGLVWGTHVAGGPDSYCYLNQAELLARGQVREVLPIAAAAPTPDAALAFVPMAHVPVPGAAGTFVPMCPAGYPLLMALARILGGRAAMFWVVPLLGGAAIWLTFVLGRRVAGSMAGLLAATLLATSPAFLYQLVQPMTDVPAVALWTLALVAAGLSPASADSRWRPALAGLATGAAVLIRPNLAPLALVVALIAAPPPLRSTGRSLIAFALGVLPFVAAVALFQHAMYGGALKSGYGKLDSLFALSHLLPNLARYPVWLLRTETPFVLLALAGPFVVAAAGPRRFAYGLLAFAAATLACYLPYEIFNDWWYLRFVLPAYPPLLILASAAFLALISRVALPMRTVAAAGAAVALTAFHLYAAVDGNAFRLRDLERRFRDAGEYVGQHLPGNAVIVTAWQSGSVRFYSGRATMTWNAIDPDGLDRALQYVRAQGFQPYLLFEGAEEQAFRRRFDGRSTIGALEWPPAADINRQTRIYDPDDRERFTRGEPVETQRVWSTRPR